MAASAAPPADEAVFARLAALSPVEYDRCREAEARKLGIRTSTLDGEISLVHQKADEAAGSDNDAPADPEPWPEPVSGAEVLDEFTSRITQHVVLHPQAAEAVALWIVHAHAHDSAVVSPILAITSPTADCRKTTRLTLLGALVRRPLPVGNLTSTTLFRLTPPAVHAGTRLAGVVVRLHEIAKSSEAQTNLNGGNQPDFYC